MEKWRENEILQALRKPVSAEHDDLHMKGVLRDVTWGKQWVVVPLKYAMPWPEGLQYDEFSRDDDEESTTDLSGDEEYTCALTLSGFIQPYSFEPDVSSHYRSESSDSASEDDADRLSQQQRLENIT